MYENILLMSDFDLAKELLSKDFLFHKIPIDEVDHYVTFSLMIGEKKALELKTKYENIVSFCQAQGITVIDSEKSGQFMGTRMRAEMMMSNKERKIILYSDSVKMLMDSIIKCCGEKYADYSYVREILICHECFHFIEELSGERVNEMLPKVVLNKIFRWERKSSVLMSSEIAAHSFCKSFMNLEYYPYVFDKIYAVDNE